MKSQLVILFTLVSSLPAANAQQSCDNLLQQYNQLCTKCTPVIKSCCELAGLPHYKAPSGVYQLLSNCSSGSSHYTLGLLVGVYCDRDCDEEWMVIQRNIKDGVKYFEDKKWKDFENGFGDLKSSKFWYGLKALHCFTQTGQWELRIDFQFENKTWSHLYYKTFSVGPESKEYPLTIGGFNGITPTDPFVTIPLNGRRFSTSDNDNDEHVTTNCAATYSAWWHNKCYHINPNIHATTIHISQFKRIFPSINENENTSS